MLPPEIISKITTLPPPIEADGADERGWPGDCMGRFTISNTYKLVCGYHELERDAIWKRIWRLEVPERIRCFIWRLRYGRIPTNKVCNRRGYGTPYCDNCVGEEETVIHAIRDCPLAHNTWKNLVPIKYRLEFFTYNYHVWFQRNMESDESLEWGIGWRVIWATTCFIFGYGGIKINLILSL
ncbi:unnamed protein product [Trifolium pratense]|uniref:Uncharacterized protein n=1 Tax=Trifolium pratense TaxID=57577 RepID=A0ACB0JHX3_TRIPR|nr:unnamed protein product [Trifolium pratense]